MTEKTPDGDNAGGDETVVLSKEEHDQMVQTLAERKEAEAKLLKEVTDLRKKNRDLAQAPQSPEDVAKAVEAEFKKREAEEIKRTIESATNEFLSEHPEFSKENDPDGSKLAAFQKSLGQFSLSGIKTKEDYQRVLENAMRLTPEIEQPLSPTPNTPRVPSFVGGKPTAKLSEKESKLVQRSFGGDVEAYLKVKTKRPEYIEGLLEYIR